MNFTASSDFNFYKVIEKACRLFPDQIALVFNEEKITYSELEVRVAKLSGLIKSKAPSEQLIAVSCTRSIQTIVNILAVLSSGKGYLPIDLDLPQVRLSKVVSDTDLKFVLPGSPQESFLSLQLTAIEESLPDQPGVENFTSDQAYILFTSGSTGSPKGIAIAHPGLTNFFEWQNQNSASKPGFKTVHFAKLTFDISCQEIFSTLTTGGTLYIVENDTIKDPLLLLEFVEKNEINRIFFPFIALQGFCNAANAYQIYPESLKEIMTAGEQLKVSLAVRKFFKKMPDCVLFNQYGPTEATIIMTEFCLKGDPDSWDDLPCIGKPIANMGAILVSKDGKLVTEAGVIAELYISGIGLATSYFKNPELTSAKFVELAFEGIATARYFKTGDLVEWTASGDLKFISRIDDQLKISGHRVELSDIEANVSKIERIDENVVITDLLNDGEVYLKLFYTSKDPTLTAEEIRRELEKLLPAYMIPAHFIKVDAIPKTTSGKVDRKTLAASPASNTKTSVQSVGRNTKNTSEILRNIWQSILQVEGFTNESNFFDLGGRSILAQKLSLEISEKLGVRFPVAFAYQYPTLNSQLKYLATKRAGSADQLDQEKPTLGSNPSRDVAVIAMAGKFPKANTIDAFWEMIKNKQEGISFFDIEELDPLIRAEAEESNYVKARGIVEGVEDFDAEFFGFNPKLAAIMDPQQRLFMEICHEALEKAGWIADRPDFKIGVFGGTNYNSYFNKNIVFDQELLDIFGPIPILTLNEKDYLTSRTAFQLNLKGPAVSVYSACSTSLLAVAQAVDSIRNGQCVAALAGGSSVTFPVRSGQVHEEGAIFSIDGHCKPFDANSTGTVFCDGAGVVLLKSYEQAVADGDPIFAVIKGVAVNNDGAEKANFTSPSVLGQADVITTALKDAQIAPSQIGYIEAHGTATPIGDPIEIEGLMLAFGKNVSNQTCSLSSVKSNVGHLTAAAGIAGLIKAICALHEKVLPASFGFDTPNPEIDFENSPFYVQKETSPWEADRKRIAGVSSFGFGGTNVHVIVEEFIPPVPIQKANFTTENLVTFSAKTERSLSLFAQQLHRYVQNRPALNLSALCQNLIKRNAAYDVQQVLSVSCRDKLLDLLQKVGNGQLKQIQRLGNFTFPVFLFPGQGAQYVGMGKSLYESNSAFKVAFDQCCEGFDRYLPTSLKFEIFEGNSETLANTRYTQPAIFTVSYAIAMALQDMGIQAAAFCGHSIGEYVGAHLSGIFSLEDAIKVVAYRGKLISELPGGIMLSVRSNTDIVKGLLPAQLSMAAHNAPNLCVVSGPADAIEEFNSVLEGLGIPSQILKTSHAFHSAMMDGALEEFSKIIESVELHLPKVPVMSTQTGTWLTDKEAQSLDYWIGQIRNAVLFSDAAATLLQDLPEAYFVEVGPGNVLNSLLQQQPESKKFPVVHTLSRTNSADEKSYLIEQIGIAYAKGAQIDLSKALGYVGFEFMDIPTYAFDKKRCWNQNGASFNPYFHKKRTLSIESEISKSTDEASSALSPSVPSNSSYRYFDKLITMLESASGVSISEEDLESSFFELGLDSLILTQFTFSIKKEFGVQISFRQLNDTHNTPKSILEFLDETLPAIAPSKAISPRETTEVFQKNGSNQHQEATSKRVEEEGAEKLSVSKQEYFVKIQKMLEAASGVVITEKNLNSSFFELGLDSLILTQFVFSLKKSFGIQISFKQLNDALNSPKSLLDYIETSLQPLAKAEKSSDQNRTGVIRERIQESPTGVNQPLDANVFNPLQNGNETTKVKIEELTISGENSISPVAKQFLAVLEEEYSQKTSKSRIQSSQLKGIKPLSPPKIRTTELRGLSYAIAADRLSDSTLIDLDGNEYLDWVNGKGGNLFGSNPAWLNQALKKQLESGLESGSTRPQADAISSLMNKLCGVDQLAICASSSEARHLAFHLAKTAYSKSLIVTFSEKGKASVSFSSQQMNEELVLEYGTQESLDLIAEHSGRIAAVLLNPIQGTIPGFHSVSFIKEIRTLTETFGICLIIDETLSGFRVHPGGIQGLIDIMGDLTISGSLGSAGFPVSILGGSPAWLETWQVNIAGNQNGYDLGLNGSYADHALALAAAKACLNQIDQESPTIQAKLAAKTKDLVARLNETFELFNCDYYAVSFESIWKIESKSNFPFWEVFFIALRHEGVLIQEGELSFMTEAHTEKDLDFTLRTVEAVLEKLIENELVKGDLPDLEEVLMDIKRPPFPGAKIGFDPEGNPIWIKPTKK